MLLTWNMSYVTCCYRKVGIHHLLPCDKCKYRWYTIFNTAIESEKVTQPHNVCVFREILGNTCFNVSSLNW